MTEAVNSEPLTRNPERALARLGFNPDGEVIDSS